MAEIITGYNKEDLKEFVSVCEYPAQVIVTLSPGPAYLYYSNLQGAIDTVPDMEIEENDWEWCPAAEEEAYELFDNFKNCDVFKVDVDEDTPGNSLIEKIGNVVTSSCDARLKEIVNKMDESIRASSCVVDDLEDWDMYGFGPDSIEKNASLYAPRSANATLSCDGKEVELSLCAVNSASFKEAYEALFKGVR